MSRLAVLFLLGCTSVPVWVCKAVAQPAESFHFDIGPQPLAHAINRIARIAGLSVLIEGQADDLFSPALEGNMTLDAALQALLRDSGGSYGFTTQGSLVVELPATLPDNTVTMLDPIVVTAAGYAQQLRDAAATVSVIDKEKLAARPTASLADALRDLPGLSVGARRSDGGTPITLRGMGQSHVLFMIDGKPLSASEEATYNGNGTGAKIGFVPPAPAIDRIEIIRGPISALHGSAALGGVINVITRPAPETWSASYDLGMLHADGHGSPEARFMFGGPLVDDRLGLMLYGGHIKQPTTDARQDISRFNLGGRLGWKISDNQSLDLDIWTSRLSFNHATLESGQVRDQGTSLTHKLRWGGDAETVSFLFRQATDFDAGYQSGHDALTFGTRTSVPFGPHHLTFGFEHRQERTRHDPDRLPDSAITSPDRWHRALYAESRLALSPDLTMTLGLRHDHNDRYGTHMTPRLYAIWQPGPGLALKGGIGSGYRIPALKQADDDVWEPSGGDGRSRDQGNSALRPEQSTNYEVGIVWEAESGLQIGATAFHTRFRNRISRADLCRTPLGQVPACELNGAHYMAVTQYVNEDSARVEGVEMTFDIPLEDMSISANYTWSNSRVTSGRNTGEPFHNVPRHMLNLNLDWQASEALRFWAQARYRSRTETLGRTAGMRGHLIADLGLSYRLRNKVTAAVGIYNVGDLIIDDTSTERRRIYLGLSGSF